MSSAAIRVLLADSIDYAGLFPPAALALEEVAANYAAYRIQSDRWALGRLVVPAACVAELSRAAKKTQAPNDGPWQISALIGANSAADLEAIRLINQTDAEHLVVDAIELRAATAGEVEKAVTEIKGVLGSDMARSTYVEVPVVDDPGILIAAVASNGARAKIRMGGVTPEVFPTPASVARFIGCCARSRVVFKATAGLHHPCRGQFRLTYADDAPVGTMFGFLNIFVAAAHSFVGTDESIVVDVLEERDAAAFHFSEQGVEWRGMQLTLGQLADARSNFIIAFGSCSFREPIDDLTRLGLA